MPPPSLAEARRGTWKQQASVTSLQLQRERGVALQRRAARAFLIIGFVTTLLGYGADFVTTEGVFEPVIPRKAANLFQPVWLGGFLAAMLAVLPGMTRGLLWTAVFGTFISTAFGSLYAMMGIDAITVACDDNRNATVATDSCPVKIYDTVVYTLVFFITDMLLLSSMRRSGGKFSLPPRQRLQRLWLAGRVVCCFFASATLPVGVIGVLDNDASPIHGISNIVSGLLVLSLVVAFSPSRRRSMTASLFDKLHFDDQSRSAAMVAAMTGGISAEAALDAATASFRAISFAKLSAEDFVSNEVNTSREAHLARTQHVNLGDCDAFVSHSWSDDPAEKYMQLSVWAASFEEKHGRKPLLWIDKFSIDQSDITQGLASLPVNLAGCSRLVCLLGPTFLTRLWCLIELHTFSVMGGDGSKLTVLPISAASPDYRRQASRANSDHSRQASRANSDYRRQASRQSSAAKKMLQRSASQSAMIAGGREEAAPEVNLTPRITVASEQSTPTTDVTLGTATSPAPGASEEATAAAILRVKAFTLRNATCFDPTDRTHLLEVIASGCGSHTAFERMVRASLSLALTGERKKTRKRMLSMTSMSDTIKPVSV